MTPHLRLVSLGSLVALGSACGTTATIYRRGAPPLEARIATSDSASLYVEDAQGQRYRVPRASVTDVDHPGNVALAIGLGCLAMGVMSYFALDPSNRGPDDARTAAALTWGIPGAVLSAWGGYSWWESTSAASHVDVASAMPLPGVVPVPTPDVVLPPGTSRAPQPPATGAPPAAPAPGTPAAFAPRPVPAPPPNP